jgi:hypothetical protein
MTRKSKQPLNNKDINMSAIDKAKAHFKTVLSQGLQGPITVPEWDLKVFFKPATTFQQESRIVELTSQGKTVEALVESLIMRALDGEGKPLFNKMDKTELMREVDPNIIMRVVTEMNDPERQTQVADALKN